MSKVVSFECDSETVVAAIRKTHAHPEWAVFQEVADATGSRASRRADAVALNLWPSRGLELRGFEVKVSRGDLQREIADPSKAEAVGKYCDTWCLAYPAGLIKPSDRIPLPWGLFEVSEKGGRYVKQPTAKLPNLVTPVSRLFMAALVRSSYEEIHSMLNSGEWVRKKDIEGKLEEAYRRGVKSAPDQYKADLQETQRQLRLLLPLAEVLGIELDGVKDWNSEKWKPALQLGLSLFSEFGFDTLDSVAKQLLRSIEQIREVHKNVVGLSLAGRVPTKEKKK